MTDQTQQVEQAGHSSVAPDWPDATLIDRARVIDGSPAASTIIVRKTAAAEFGLWRATPGTFASARKGQEEYVYIIDGDGDLVGDDGAIQPLHPGATVVLHDGWHGHWCIRSTVTKSYVLLQTGTL